MSVGCFENDVQVVFTTGLAGSIKPSFVEYVCATMISGKLMTLTCAIGVSSCCMCIANPPPLDSPPTPSLKPSTVHALKRPFQPTPPVQAIPPSKRPSQPTPPVQTIPPSKRPSQPTPPVQTIPPSKRPSQPTPPVQTIPPSKTPPVQTIPPSKTPPVQTIPPSKTPPVQAIPPSKRPSQPTPPVQTIPPSKTPPVQTIPPSKRPSRVHSKVPSLKRPLRFRSVEPSVRASELMSLLAQPNITPPPTDPPTPSGITPPTDPPTPSGITPPPTDPPTPSGITPPPTDPSDVTVQPLAPSETWLPCLHLSMLDKEVLESPTMWVNDNIIRAALSLLCDESSERISGWANTQPCRNRFQEIPIERPFVQIFFVSNNHWITVSNIGSRAGNTVCIYDSMRPSS